MTSLSIPLYFFSASFFHRGLSHRKSRSVDKIKDHLASKGVMVILINRSIIFCFSKVCFTGLDFHSYFNRQENMDKLTKTEIMEKLLKLLQTDRDVDFLLALDEKDLTTLLIALRERIEQLKKEDVPMVIIGMNSDPDE